MSTSHLTNVTKPSTTQPDRRNQVNRPVVTTPTSKVGMHVIPNTQTQPTHQHGVRQKPGTELKYNT